jgi:hypothetical protein
MAAATLPHLTNILGLDALPLPPAILTLFFNLSFFNQNPCPLRGGLDIFTGLNAHLTSKGPKAQEGAKPI